MSPETFHYILQNHNRVAIVGGPQVGKTTLAKLAKDRPVFHNDDNKHLPWEDIPEFIKSQVHGNDKFVVEGVQVARAMRKGMQVDAVIHLEHPFVELKPGQKAMHKGHSKILTEALLKHPPVTVYK